MQFNEVFVAGSGFMGAGIAQTCAMSGLKVVLYDINEAIVISSREKINTMIQKLVSKGKMTPEEGAAAIGRISVTTDMSDAKNTDIAIEAAPERLDIKKDIFAKLDRFCKPDAILATNTSSLPITAMAGVTRRPDKVIGTHFFSPVPLMKLCEIVVGYTTSEETYENTVAFAKQIKKETIRAYDKGGFVVDRMLNLFLNEAANLLEEGVGTVEDIDNGCKWGLNHPMGPLELMDLVGCEITLAVMETLYDEYKDPRYRPSTLLKTMVRAGHCGRKTGIGFYDYREGTQKPIKR
ncbi:3-hydroxyacyl-CoA dehydrogenase family protein [Sinanaerobacter chloroacetimidivorans]|uniref:3-hydroxybutyryl-CoA dehydrogenase n=1 Tax=Sinanaerobacter chloroacetimidivorans TaxID=2818044 RepID=A0A8J7W2T1_9FIRM|nr:3-hydroxyacyl-CoA dehydrogenase NAD-binding domain-containing protein [Sinanaerobacter chloroacetimidivorans]MBR0597845.1 3-hydroxybutyryl-CoA dehydrogenase [Sinanaerobacter chloroacetimidivorans]